VLTIIAWIRIIFCQGPQKVVNALTLYSVFRANLDPTDASDVGQSFLGFFKNIGILADQNHQQVVILSGMAFTLIIWVLGALSLILGCLFYILFLWHYIPNSDSGLSGYCERKINQRLAKIVSAKVNKALEEEERKRRKADAKAIKKGEKPIGRQATLPTLFDQKDGGKLPEMPMLNRNDTMTTLPLYSSRPGTPSSGMPGFELDQWGNQRPGTARTVTGGSAMSNASYASDAPLMGNASDMGYGRSGSPAPSLLALDTNGFPRQPQRTMTANSQNSQWNRGPPGPPRMPSAMGDRGYTQSPVSYTDSQRSPSSATDPYGRPIPRAVGDLRSNTPQGPPPSMGRRTPFDAGGRASPAPSSDYGRSSPAPQRGPPSEYGRSSPAPQQLPSPTNSNRPYVPYNPNQNQRSASAAQGASYSPGPGQQFRNMTDPGMRPPQSSQSDYVPMPSPQRSMTGMNNPPMNNGRGTPTGPQRLASPAPYVNHVNGRGSPQGQQGYFGDAY
jgi:hypothetical protein